MQSLNKQEEEHSHWALWTRNVQDHLKSLPTDTIKEKLKENSLPFGILMMNVQQDFNIGSVIRSANGFGARDFFYYGKRHFDKRGCLGSYKYVDVNHLREFEEIIALKERYVFVGLENNVNRHCVNIKDFQWSDKPCLILVGEENCGLSEEVLDLCDHLIYIDMGRGSVRSFNAAVASSIAMFDYVNKTTAI
jgi:tRNA(Leu) C34 or U34 (ribose-2'-O)-methylase TrmL